MTERTEDERGVSEARDTQPDALATIVEELQAELDRLANRDLPLVVGTVRALIDADVDSIEALPDAARHWADQYAENTARLVAVEERLTALRDVGGEQTTKEQKIAAVLAYADNKRDTEQTTIAVSAPEIKGCVGVSRRYAYDLIDEIATSVEGCRLRERTEVTTGTGTKAKPKAVLIDCEVVQRETEGVNNFTTDNGATHRHETTTDGGTE